jgi:quercetin dioxygenase-like cupin family protein
MTLTTEQELAMKSTPVRLWTISVSTAAIAVAVGGMALAQHVGKNPVTVAVLSQQDIVEKLDGKDARLTVEVVTIEPGQEDSAHRHTGPVFGYVLEGEYEHALDDEPTATFKAGDTFYEPSGSLHRVTRNPSGKTQTRLLAVVLHPRDTTQATVREKAKEGELR